MDSASIETRLMTGNANGPNQENGPLAFLSSFWADLSKQDKIILGAPFLLLVTVLLTLDKFPENLKSLAVVTAVCVFVFAWLIILLAQWRRIKNLNDSLTRIADLIRNEWIAQSELMHEIREKATKIQQDLESLVQEGRLEPENQSLSDLSALVTEIDKYIEKVNQNQVDLQRADSMDLQRARKSLRRARLLLRGTTSDEVIQALGERFACEKSGSEPKPHFKVSAAHPKFLSKRCTSTIIINFYLQGYETVVREKVKEKFSSEFTESFHEVGNLFLGLSVVIGLFHPNITFSEKKTKKLGATVNTLEFSAQPDDNCFPGIQAVLVVVNDKETGEEYESFTFNVRVADFAFDHVPQPWISKLYTSVLGTGSLVMFVLSLFGKVDSAFGLASGTVGGIAAAFVYQNHFSNFKKMGVKTLS